MSKSKAWLKKQEQARKEAEENREIEDAAQGGMSPNKRGWQASLELTAPMKSHRSDGRFAEIRVPVHLRKIIEGHFPDHAG